MGETMDSENAAFWLPTHFLTDDDFLADADRTAPRSFKKDQKKNFDLFSNGFGFGFGFDLDSPVSSTETERGDAKGRDDIDDEFLAELTRQLAQSTLQETRYKPAYTEKPRLFSTSPQSTLTGFGAWSNRSGFSSNGSPNGPSSQVPSPPLTPPAPAAKNDAAWELLYEAAGQVAMLKMNAIAAQMNHNQQQQNRGLLGAPCNNPSLACKPNRLNSFYDFPPTSQYQQVKRHEIEREGWFCQHHHQRRTSDGGALGLPQSAWPPLRSGQPQNNHHHHPHSAHQQQHHRQPTGGSGMRAIFLGGPGSGVGPASVPGMKRQSTGTGVFLPRRVGTPNQPEPRKKPTGCSPVLLPARVVQALNLDVEEINNGVNANSQSRFGTGFVSDHDILMARRNALMGQQRRSFRTEGTTLAVGHEIRLPNDWTY